MTEVRLTAKFSFYRLLTLARSLKNMERGSLYALIHNDTVVLEGDQLLHIMQDVAQGIRFLHASRPQVVHGALRAENVFVDAKFRAKVGNFGQCQKNHVESGGLYWMAPEFLLDYSRNTTKSDSYAFGITVYEIYSRKEPYEGEDNDAVIASVTNSSIRKRPTIPKSCPLDVQILMMECLEHEPDRRPDFAQLDERLRELNPTSVEPDSLRTHRTDTLLNDVFPKRIADVLRKGMKVEPESRDEVSIYFSDVVNFTGIAENLEPLKVANMLDRLYHKIDDLSHEFGVWKMETIGDAWMGVTNLVEDQADHAKRIASFAVATIKAAQETLVDEDNPRLGYVNIRVGFHT